MFVIDASLVRGLLTRQFPQWADLPAEPVEPDGSGWAWRAATTCDACLAPRVWLDDADPSGAPEISEIA